MSRLIGIDIGGTKCAVSLGETEGETLRILAKKIFATPNRDPNAKNYILYMGACARKQI